MDDSISALFKNLLPGQHEVICNGFVFTKRFRIPAIVLRAPLDAPCGSPRIPLSQRSLAEHIEYINKNKIESALVIANDLHFISKCPCLKYITAIPADNANHNFSFSPLYELKRVKRLTCYTAREGLKTGPFSVDYANFPNVESIHISGTGHKNFNQLKRLKNLGISGYNKSDLTQMFSSPVLSTLTMINCKVKTLDGLQQSKKMQCLYLYYNRSLNDISALREVKNTLRALRIENCAKINDFSVLEELENLELLELSGSNELPSLNFIGKMKKLKTFVFSVNVKDGDLSPCLNLSYVYSSKNRKHYNLKDADLPKGRYVRGNETLPDWLRLE